MAQFEILISTALQCGASGHGVTLTVSTVSPVNR